MPWHTQRGFLNLLVSLGGFLSLAGIILLAALGQAVPEVLPYVLVASVSYLTGHAVGKNGVTRG